jgi:hypothetical protein
MAAGGGVKAGRQARALIAEWKMSNGVISVEVNFE